MPRTPKPVAPPSTLAAAVLDLEDRMTGGDALSEVLLPAEDWTRLVEMAEDADLPSAELVALRILREDLREFLAMGPAATPLDLMHELEKTVARAREGWAPTASPVPGHAALSAFREQVRNLLEMHPGASDSGLLAELEIRVNAASARTAPVVDVTPPPAKSKRQRKAKAEAPAEPEAPQHRMRIEDVEEDAA